MSTDTFLAQKPRRNIKIKHKYKHRHDREVRIKPVPRREETKEIDFSRVRKLSDIQTE